MGYNLLEQQFLKFWKETDFNNWNESDIREDFIAPLLKILGYAKGTVDTIIREQSLVLSEKYHRIGRKYVSIDYVPTVRLKKFWIIEAKPGKPKTMDFGDFLQAHLYAIHPEMNVRFIVMTNGWEIRLYDAISSNTWDDYLCCSTQDDCETTFSLIQSFISSKSITESIRKHILSTIKESLLIEVDEKLADDLRSQVNEIYFEVLPKIRNNAHELKILTWRRIEEESKKWISTLTSKQLLIYLDRPTEPVPIYSNEYIERIKNGNYEDRETLYTLLIQTCYGRPHAVLKVQTIRILCELIRDEVDFPRRGKPIDKIDELESLITYNMEYGRWPVGDILDHIGFALSHLDNITARVSYKFCRRFTVSIIEEILSAKRDTLSAEDLLISQPTVARELVDSVRVLHEILWFKYNGEESREIWETIWTLQVLESYLDKIPTKPYSDDDKDVLYFDRYGIDHDMLCLGTWNVLKSYEKDLSKRQLPESAKNILSKSRQEIIDAIPKPLEKPNGWKFKESILLNLLKGFSK